MVEACSNVGEMGNKVGNPEEIASKIVSVDVRIL
jgi:hypothetical protein